MFSIVGLCPFATGRGVIACVIDSGWDRRCHDARVLKGVAFADDPDSRRLAFSEDDQDRNGHGTSCTNLLLDAAPDCQVIPVRVFGRRLETSVEVLVAAIDYAVFQKVRVISLSLGTLRVDAIGDLYRACSRAKRAGVVTVAAARVGTASGGYPAVFESVLSVGTSRIVDPNGIDYRAGAAIECCVSAARPAKGLGAEARWVTGSSYGAPVVAGLVARLIEVDPHLDIDVVREGLLRASVAVWI